MTCILFSIQLQRWQPFLFCLNPGYTNYARLGAHSRGTTAHCQMGPRPRRRPPGQARPTNQIQRWPNGGHRALARFGTPATHSDSSVVLARTREGSYGRGRNVNDPKMEALLHGFAGKHLGNHGGRWWSSTVTKTTKRSTGKRGNGSGMFASSPRIDLNGRRRLGRVDGVGIGDEIRAV